MSTTSTTSGNDEIVKLNVGGKTFTTYKSTFMTYPDTMLARMFSSSAEIAKKGADGEYFIDRNPELFEIILEFYRNKAIIVPKKTSLEALRNELQYFGIDYEDDDIQIAGELVHAPIDCYISLSNAFKVLPRKGHLLGNVVMGLPMFDYEDDEYSDEPEKKEVNLKERFNTVGQGLKNRNFLANGVDVTDNNTSESDSEEANAGNSPPSKKTKMDQKEQKNETKNGEYEDGAIEALEQLQKSMSDVTHDSYFCCGGTEKCDTATRLLMLPPPVAHPNNNNNNNTNPNPDNKPVCKFGTNCYRKNPQHIADMYHGPPLPKKKGSKGAPFQQFVDCGALKDINIDLVKNMCTPAPFGDLKTMQTKLDPNVRQALECSSDRFQLSSFGIKEVTNYIALKLNSFHGVKVVPYKLNIYEPGGFFKEHVDTPINPSTMIGSLVMCLPSEHEGGELKITHNGLSHTFDFAEKSKNKNIIQWAAFYSDCVHEVKPVTKGIRITITYTIETTNSSPVYGYLGMPKHAFSGPVDASMSSAKMDSLIQNLCALPPFIQKIGLFLSHKYTSSAVDMETLKGSDRLLVEKAGAKWNYFLTPVVYNEYMKTNVGEYDNAREYDEKSGCVFAFSMDDLKYVSGKGPKPNHKFTAVPFVVSEQKGRLLYHNSDEGAEHTGNESRPAEEDSVYFHVVVILTRK